MLTTTLITYSRLFLRDINVKDFRVFFESSPEYPNLISVVGTLRYFGLNVAAGKCDWEYLNKLKSPFLIHINYLSRESLAISRWNNNQNTLEVLHPKKHLWQERNKEYVIKHWNGVVIYTDATPIKFLRINNLFNIRNVLIVIFVLIISLITIKYKTNITYSLPIIFGTVISICIYLQKYISPIKIVDKICHSNSYKDCEAVENSKYAYFGKVSISCLALSFFIAQLVCLLVGDLLMHTTVISTLYYPCVILVIPITIYSIYSQYQIKKICPFCILILTCIIFQSWIFIILPNHVINSKLLISWIVSVIYFLTLSVLYSKLREADKERTEFKIENLRLKRSNKNYFVKYPCIEHTSIPIKLVSEGPKISITTIISPGCKHCKNMVNSLFTLLNNNIVFQWNIILGKTNIHESETIKKWIEDYNYNKDTFTRNLYLWSLGTDQFSYKTIAQEEVSLKAKEMYQENEKVLQQLKIKEFPQIIFNDRLLSPDYTAKDIEILIVDQSNIMTS